MEYPFEKYRSTSRDKETFLKLLPNVSAALPEYFRALSVAHHSIEQKNMFNQPQGIHQSTGLTSSLNLLLVAMVNDRVISVNAELVKFIDALRILVLKWYSFGNDLKACVYFGYYYYTHKSASEHEVRQQLDAIRFLVDESSRVSQDPIILQLMKPPNSRRWFAAESHIGDKLYPLTVQAGDFARVDLPRPAYQVSFKASQMFDLRVPITLTVQELERPQISQGKAIVSCPACGQKCRIDVYKRMEIKCPTCQQVWTQST
jgi:hypothetical protein